MTEKEFTLCDGIYLYATQTNKFKMTRLSFSFILPADERLSPKTKLALSCMMRGTKKYPTITKINRRLDELYDTTVALRIVSDGDRHIFRVYCEMIDECYIPEKVDILGGTLEIIKDIFFNFLRDENNLICKNNFESEKKIACDEIRSKINDQRAYAAERCREIMFEGEKAGIICEGKLDTVQSLTREEVSAKAAGLFEDAKIVCCYVGSRDGEEIAARLTELFSNIKSRHFCDTYQYEKCDKSDGKVKNVEESMPVSQGRLQMGFRCDTYMTDGAEYFAMCLFNEIFGGMSTSKLFMNVREKKSLCYYCSSGYMASKGAIFVSCGIKPENKDAAYKEIMTQLKEMKSGNITDEEINSAKRSLINGYRQITDNPVAIEAFSFRKLLNGISLTADECIDAIHNVTIEDIKNAAGKVRLDTVYFLNGTATCDGEAEQDEA